MTMQQASKQLSDIISSGRPRLESIPEGVADEKPYAQKWSRKEILGHLIDSAANNHQRFVRMQELRDIGTFRYSQEHWVRSQAYQREAWLELIQFWFFYNRHLAHVIANVKSESLAATCDVGEAQPVTLELVVRDYIRHVQHHLDQIFSTDDPRNRKRWE
jgi:hypothetical protein